MHHPSGPPHVTLPDGRALAYDDVGAPDGDVVVWFHGAPDCRLARHPDDSVTASAGIRLIALDRPGYGRSDPPPTPGFGDTAADLGVLLDALGVERCRVVAWSAGSPRALAAATALGDRVSSVTCYAAIPPLDACLDPAVRDATAARLSLADGVLRDGYPPERIARHVVELLVPPGEVSYELALDIVDESLGGLSRAELGAVPGAKEVLARSMAEAVAVHGSAGLLADLIAQLTVGHVDDVVGLRCPVRFVHGDKDAISGPAVGRWYADQVADATLEVWEGAGHHAVFPRWLDLIRAP